MNVLCFDIQKGKKKRDKKTEFNLFFCFISGINISYYINELKMVNDRPIIIIVVTDRQQARHQPVVSVQRCVVCCLILNVPLREGRGRRDAQTYRDRYMAAEAACI
jgi:hypothetical protein